MDLLRFSPIRTNRYSVQYAPKSYSSIASRKLWEQLNVFTFFLFFFFFTFPNTAWITNNKNRKLISICWGFFYWTNKGLIFIGWKCHITTTCWCLIPLFVLQTLHNEVLPLALLWRLSWGTLSTQPGAMRSRPTTLLQLPARAVILIHTQGVLSVFSTCTSPTLLHEPFYCCES